MLVMITACRPVGRRDVRVSAGSRDAALRGCVRPRLDSRPSDGSGVIRQGYKTTTGNGENEKRADPRDAAATACDLVWATEAMEISESDGSSVPDSVSSAFSVALRLGAVLAASAGETTPSTSRPSTEATSGCASREAA